MRTALLGFTGFVGSNIAARHDFDDLYNSSNIDELAGRDYGLVVTAANRADSFRINRDGEADLAEVDALIDRIERARIGRLVLISTVCVYPEGGAPTESTPRSPEGLTPYGRNRLHQEERLSAAFDTTIVRLPQLYGDGLKKGLVYDLANDYRVEFVRPEASFQYYDVRRLWSDIEVALAQGLDAVNPASPAISNATVAREVFGIDVTGNDPGPADPFASMYTRNMRSEHAELFGGGDGFFTAHDETLAQIAAFVEELEQKAN